MEVWSALQYGMAKDNRLSARTARLAAALRHRAGEVERVNRFGLQLPDLDDAFVEEFNEVLRRLGLRMVYEPKVSDPNTASASALREEAASLEEIAATIRGTTPYRLDRSELRGCVLTLLIIAAGGGALLWFDYGPTWIGIALIGVVMVTAGIVAAMHHDTD